MIRVERKSFDDLSKAEISLIERFNDEWGGLIFHEPQFNLIVCDSFHTQLSYWLAYGKEGTLIGFCPCHSEKRGSLLYSYASPTHYDVFFGGWVFDSSLVSHEELIGRMKYKYNEIGIYFSSIQYPNDTLINSTLPLKKLATPIIDLSQSEEDIWTKSLKSSRRNRVRKAQKEGVVVRTYGAEGFEQLMPCLRDLHKKINMKDKPDSFYRRILEHYAPLNKARVFLAEKDGEVLSGCVVIGNHRYMHGWEAGIKENMPSIGLYEIMYWENIVWAKQAGAAFMDFCVIDEEKLPQIAFFKLEFTSHVVPFYHMVKAGPMFRILAKLQNLLK